MCWPAHAEHRLFLRASLRVVDADGEDFVGVDGGADHVAGHGERAALGRLHHVGDGGRRGAGRNVKFDGRVLACPFIGAEDQALGVFSLLHGGQNDIVARGRSKGMLGGQRAGVRRRDHGGERVVVFPAVADGERVFPRAGVRIERVVEVVMAHVGIGIGPFGRAQQREPEQVADRIVAEL